MTAASRHMLGFASKQSLNNLTQRTVELEVIPALRHLGIGLISWSLIGMGLLGGVLGKITEGRRATTDLQSQIEKTRPQLEAYEAFCRELDEIWPGPGGEAPMAYAWSRMPEHPLE